MRRIILGTLALLLCWSNIAAAFGAEDRSLARARLVQATRNGAELAGTTVVTGHRTAMQVVSLPRDVVVKDHAFDSPLIDIAGGGKLSGLVLKEVKERDGFELMALKLAHCASLRCQRRATTYAGIYPPFRKSRKVTIPAGDYYLYLLSDGAPVTATLNLPGLSGRNRLRPTFKGDAPVGDLDTLVEQQNTKMLYSGTTRHTIGHAGITLVGARMTAQKQEITEIESCVRERKGADVPVTHYMLCLDGGGGVLTYENTVDRHSVLLISYALVNAGDYQHTLSYRAVAEIEEVEAFHAFVAYPDGARAHSSFGTIFGWSD